MVLSCYTIEFHNSYLLLYFTSLKGKACTGIFDIVFFDEATNVQNFGSILAARYHRISVGHGAEHVVTLLFLDVFYKIPAYESLMNFANRLCNIFGNIRYATTSMFNNYSKMHNRGIKVGFIKRSD